VSRLVAAVLRHSPGARRFAIQRAFLHGYHAGRHDFGVIHDCDAECEQIVSMDAVASMRRPT
jgi:hypothetical protein